MNVPTAGQKRFVIVAATGMVGGYALRYALEHPAVGRVTVIGRRKVGAGNMPAAEKIGGDHSDSRKNNRAAQPARWHHRPGHAK